MSQDTFGTSGSQSSSGGNYSGSGSYTAGGTGGGSEQGNSGMMGGIKDRLSEGAQALGSQAKEQASSYVESGKGAVTESLEQFAQAIRKASDELSRQDQSMAAQMIRQAANGLEGLSRSIEGTEIDDVVRAARQFGRRNPTVLIGGAVLAGLALGRFARASSQRSSDWDDDWRYGGRQGWDRQGGSNLPARSYSGYSPGGSAYGAGRGPGSSAGGGSSGSSGGGGAGSSYPSGNRSFGDTPSPSQGYAGGGMSSDPIQSSGPSSATSPSVGGSSQGGSAAQPGSISTGESS